MQDLLVLTMNSNEHFGVTMNYNHNVVS